MHRFDTDHHEVELYHFLFLRCVFNIFGRILTHL